MDKETSICLDVLVGKCKGQISQRKIAEMLGISKSVVNRRAVQLKGGATPVYSMSTTSRDFAETESGSASGDRLGILCETRDLLMESMREVTGTARANVARELRETLSEIDALSDVGDEDDPLAEILAAHGK